MKPKISLILPVYNAEKYLLACLNSIVNQTYKDFELIIIDDGSSDNSSLICRSYSDKYNFIKFFSIENNGVCNAWKYGLSKTEGDYIGAVDSDDMLQKDFLLEMVSALEDDVDIVMCGYKTFVEDSDIIEDVNNLPTKVVTMSGVEAIKATLQYNSIAVSRWNKLIKKDLLNKVSGYIDSKIAYGEDFLMSMLCFCNSKKILQLDKVLYFYRQVQDSLSKVQKKHLPDIVLINSSIKEYRKYNDNIDMQYLYRHFYSFFMTEMTYVVKNHDKNYCYEVISYYKKAKIIKLDFKLDSFKTIIFKLLIILNLKHIIYLIIN